MIKKIPFSKHDADVISSKIGSAANQSHADSSIASSKLHCSVSKFDYKNLVVTKPWGYEYLLFENEEVAVWILFLKQGAKTSMHCHPIKRTSLLVLEGEVQTSSLADGFDLTVFDGIMIDRGVFHSTSSKSDMGAFVMEIETPPQKTDLVRLQDEYGREDKGYESGDNLSRDLANYEHQSFDKDIDLLTEERKTIEKVIKRSKIMLHSKEDWHNLHAEILAKDFCVISFLDTVVTNKKGDVILDVGEICESPWFLTEYAGLMPCAKVFTVLTIY